VYFIYIFFDVVVNVFYFAGRKKNKIIIRKYYTNHMSEERNLLLIKTIADMVSRRISPEYSRTGRGDLWLAVGLDTRGLDSPWVCFRPPSRRRYVNVIMGVINPARTRLNLARSWGGRTRTTNRNRP